MAGSEQAAGQAISKSTAGYKQAAWQAITSRRTGRKKARTHLNQRSCWASQNAWQECPCHTGHATIMRAHPYSHDRSGWTYKTRWEKSPCDTGQAICESSWAGLWHSKGSSRGACSSPHEHEVHCGGAEEADEPGEAVQQVENRRRLLRQTHSRQKPWTAGRNSYRQRPQRSGVVAPLIPHSPLNTH